MKNSNLTSAKKPSARRIQVRQSGVHGKGVFASQNILKGETIIEYVGEIISAQEAEARPSLLPASRDRSHRRSPLPLPEATALSGADWSGVIWIAVTVCMFLRVGDSVPRMVRDRRSSTLATWRRARFRRPSLKMPMYFITVRRSCMTRLQ